MVFLRLVTDCGDAARITQEDITRSMQAHRDALLRACHRFLQMASLLSQQREDPLQAHRQTVEQTASALRASVSMKLQLEQLLRYAELSGLPWREVLEAYRDSGLLPVGSRKEGKERLEQLMRDLTDPAGEPHLC